MPTTQSTNRYYRPELDMIRFLGFLMVFLHHNLPSIADPRVIHLLGRWVPALNALTNACGLGVDLFFALSAFLICELLLREREASGQIQIKQFYIRRLLRIWPLYFLGITLGALLALSSWGRTSDLGRMGWFVVFLGAWEIVWHGPISNPIAPLWSISVEEQFYLFAPWSVKYLKRQSLYGFCFALFIFTNACLFYLGRSRVPDESVWFNSFVQYQSFSGGIFLCLILRGRLPRFSTWIRVVLLIASATCLFLSCFTFHLRFTNIGEQNPGSWALICGFSLTTLGCVLTILAFLGISTESVPAWAVYLGRISFGLYVFHSFADFFIDHLLNHFAFVLRSSAFKPFQGPFYLLIVAMKFGLTLMMAALSYRYFETPFLKMKRRHAVIVT